MSKYSDELFEKSEPTQISAVRRHALMLLERFNDPKMARSRLKASIETFKRERDYCSTASYVPLAFTLVNMESMLCLRTDEDGGLGVEAWPSEMGDMPLGDAMMWKQRLEGSIGAELAVMGAAEYFVEFARQAPERISYCYLLLEEIDTILQSLE
ncbi:MAG: hypothetical protein E5X49_15120 [Mesorhizobium sp.]|uniref:hypothetical protein n=1 Tax=Mesorhizobium sp. TaxID=1871066 RepID=UPI000FE2C49D|nr:hypothetical protein [Mesorhizobium sp.]RWG86610.1 MAG: hypothetical protein EOQ69_04345 [Mesorhizobium sp.]RWK22902.1 MAG: hypothetical protein EOR43_16445 [Mesorhizobium sp.]RWK28630.1 MAG: hypothetical protein EOR44_22565 [Mesorhizobium sp.]TIQ42267.1 MAG: hypothetical protein E5X49_15120 [Mesorhizobium sp.]